MNELMRPNIPDDFGFIKLQNIILNIAQYIDNFCRENNIKYCLMGGSALGAKRHGGFIPWDDDLDIFMTPTEYERFRSAFGAKGDNVRFSIQELGASNGKVITSKLRLNNSYYEEEIVKGWKIHHGIYVDIFILHNCPDNYIPSRWQYFWAKYLIIKGLANKQYHRRNGLAGFIVKLAKVLPKRFLLNYGLKQVYRWRDKETKYYCNFLGKALFKNGRYKHEYFCDVKRISFETIELNAPILLEEFLKDRFGDYIKPPTPERIKYEQHSTTWDIGEYDYTDRSDEKYLF